MEKVNILTRGQMLLLDKLGNMSQDTQNAYTAGAVQMIDSAYFKRMEVTGKSNSVEILDNDDARVDGVTNISKQKINQGENLAVERIGVKLASIVADTVTPGTAIYKPVSESTDGAAVNAEIELRIAQKRVFRGPLSLFNEEKGEGSEKMWFTLTAPKLVTDADEISVQLYVPKGAAIDATSSKKSFIEVVLDGPCLNTKK